VIAETTINGVRLELSQAWPRPSRPRPIAIIGAGGIVRSAHLPAYRRLGYPVAGVYDIRLEAAQEAAREFATPVFPGLDGAVASPDCVFDIAVPGDQVLRVLESIPAGSAALIQKPMGLDLTMARQIRAVCRQKKLVAAINFQLRFSPNVLALRDLITRGGLGAVSDIDVRVVIHQPWRLWPFLKTTPRLEVLYHSIHYLDAIRFLAGEPRGVYCRAVGHPDLPEYKDTRSSIILDYDDRIRCSLILNHTHRQGPRYHASQMMVEGAAGAAVITMGVNLDYPAGVPDTMEISQGDGEWLAVPLRGSWFTEAFEGPISNLQRFVAGEDKVLVTSVEDAIRTMALVEACYESSARGATPIPAVD
jgi:predicted dehydrogenase